MLKRSILATAVFIAATAPAYAHLDPAAHGSFMAGFSHPLFGLDHVLAMVAVGLWAAQRGGRALWLWPLAFVGVMLVGGVLGMAGVPIPAPVVEPGIMTSILVLGLLIAFAAKPGYAWGAGLIGCFALLHGHAHGTEAGRVDMAVYAAGFVIATAGLHLAGMGLGLMASRLMAPSFVRAAGVLTAVTGFGLALAG